MSKFLAAALCLGLAGAAPSLSSCGSATDHFKNVVMSISPDPIQKGQAFTVTVSGDLDEAITDLKVAANLNIKALDIVSKTIDSSAEVTLSPGFAAGKQSIIIGPFALPNIAGDAIVSGQVHLTDAQGQGVACIDLDLNMPLEQAEPAAAAVAATATCTTPQDHLKNIQESTTGGVTTVTATLDEALTTVNVDVNLKVKALFIDIPLQLTIPISYTPGVQQGAWTITTKKISSSVMDSEGSSPISVEGQVKVTDGNNQQITCVDIQKSSTEMVV